MDDIAHPFEEEKHYLWKMNRLREYKYPINFQRLFELLLEHLEIVSTDKFEDLGLNNISKYLGLLARNLLVKLIL